MKNRLFGFSAAALLLTAPSHLAGAQDAAAFVTAPVTATTPTVAPQNTAPVLQQIAHETSRTCYPHKGRRRHHRARVFKESSVLIPEFRAKLNLLMAKLTDMGIEVRVTAATRSRAEQDRLYSKGRTTAGPIVTGRPGGYDWHEYGVAADVVPIVNGRADWHVPVATWTQIAAVAKKVGLVMGADIRPPRQLEIPPELRANKRAPIGHDYPHLQLAGLPAYPTQNGLAYTSEAGRPVADGCHPRTEYALNR